MPTTIKFGAKPNSFSPRQLVVLGEPSSTKSTEFLSNGLEQILVSNSIKESNNVLVKNVELNEGSGSHGFLVGESHLSVQVATISGKKGRNTGIIRSDVIHTNVAKFITTDHDAQVVFVVDEDQIFASGCAASRAFPQYSHKASFLAKPNRTVHISFVNQQGHPIGEDIAQELQYVSDNIRLAARLTDTPCSELYTDSYIQEVRELIKDVEGVSLEVIQGKELEERGFGGLWNVGKAAVHLPALVILKYQPNGDEGKKVCLVGKGICYDTGGLSLKSTTGMPTMKVDMGGSAAVLGAFIASARAKVNHTLYGLLCLAENSCDQLSMRPDDVITMYSGVTVEVNNTDAEGRLVLGDGVSYASKHLQPDYIIDIATLTGAQLMATGPNHAAVLSTHQDFEYQVMKASHSSGDLAHPIIYAPEFLLKDIDSAVADYKNSNKNGPTTAASSLAAHFIEANLDAEYQGVWCHIDMAGPVTKGQRATGYGVALLYNTIKNL